MVSRTTLASCMVWALVAPAPAQAAMDWTFTVDPFAAGTIQSIGGGAANVTWSAVDGNPGGAVSTFDGFPDGSGDAAFWSNQAADELQFSGVGSTIGFSVDFEPTSNTVAAGGNLGNRLTFGFFGLGSGTFIGGGYDYDLGTDPVGFADFAVLDSVNGDQFSYASGVSFVQDAWSTAQFQLTLGVADLVTWTIQISGANSGTYSYSATLPGIGTDTMRAVFAEDGGQTWWDNVVLSNTPEPGTPLLLASGLAGTAAWRGRRRTRVRR